MQKDTEIQIDYIESIEKIKYDGCVYDVSCDDPHLYVTNGFISHNCVLWIDEVEKGIQGSKSSGTTDGGVSSRILGTLLTWMQEKTSPVFVACTANDVFGIPPEFMRAGRFDEVFFVDLPDEQQRCEVIEKILLRKKRNPVDFDVNSISSKTDHYSPAEIEKVIDNALFIAYADSKRQLTTDDIVNESSSVIPLYKSREEEVKELRKWALGSNGSGGRARLANATEKKHQKKISKTDPSRAKIMDLDI